MGLKGAVALATLLPILLGGCDLFTRYEWHHPSATAAAREADERDCTREAVADVGSPPIEPPRRYPTKKQVRRYQSESCSKKCAHRKAERDVNLHYDIEERAYDRERSRYDSSVRQGVADCMTALGYVRRGVPAK